MSKIKEILCLHHSHLDIGYTHPQHMLTELQCDYIDQALDLCVKTADYPEESRFRWTCEATYPVEKWIKTADPSRLELLRNMVRAGQIEITALPMHTTPGCTVQQFTKALSGLDTLRNQTDCRIKSAINHDVNGQPWTIASLLLDSKVDFYITGINIHFGGIPMHRPYLFNWQAPDGRLLPTMLGEHYSLFSQFFFTYENNTARMHEGVTEYVERMENADWWPYDFVYLTATNPPLYDNNSPDENLADLMRRYNDEGHEQKVRFVTPSILFERVSKIGLDTLPIHSGDWTDYWNFGSASTAREQRISRRAKALLSKADFLECVASKKASVRENSLREKAYQNALLYEEHTWNAAESVTKPDQEETYVQSNHKKDFVYRAADCAAYLVSSKMERMAGNARQSDGQEGFYLVNPNGFTVRHRLEIPQWTDLPGRTLYATRMKNYLPYPKEDMHAEFFGTIELPPFSTKRIAFSALEKQNGKPAKSITIKETEIITPFYHLTLDSSTGRIRQIKVLASGKHLLDESSEYSFFEPVNERIDKSQCAVERRTFFPRDVDLGNRNVSQWNHDWSGVRMGLKPTDYNIEQNGEEITLVYHGEMHDTDKFEQRITLSSIHPRIGLTAEFIKNPVREPESIYFAFPLQLEQGWECVYDTAETFVRLDEQQLGTSCRDWVTVGRSVSMLDKNGGITLSCPDAPMIQAGGFNFGKESKKIERKQNPLLLSWAMNNYWDTNFDASQSGHQLFCYALSTFSKFLEQEAYQAGMQAADPGLTGAAIVCDTCESDVLISGEWRDAMPIFFMPNNDESFTVAVKNFSDDDNTCSLALPYDIDAASITDIQGTIKQVLTIKANKVTIPLTPHAIVFAKITTTKTN